MAVCRSFLLLVALFLADACQAEIMVRNGQDLIGIANSAPPGETLIVSPGTYAGGTLTNRVTIRFAETSGHAKFRSGVSVQADGVTLEGLTWAEMDGQLLEIRASDVTVRRCQFRLFGLDEGVAAKAIWIREDAAYNNTLIEDSLFEDWGNPTEHSSCIKVSQLDGAQPTGTVIRNNLFRDGVVGGNNVAVQLFAPTLVEGNEIYFVEDGIEVKGSGSTIRGNLLHHNFGYEQLSNRSGSNNLFENNIVHDTQGPMAWVAEGSNIVYRNNLFFHNGDGMRLTGLVPDQYAQITNIQIVNNVFYDNVRELTTDSRQTDPPQQISLLNNAFAYGSLEGSADAIANADFNLYYQTSPANRGAHDLVGVDPQFVDANAGNFRLLPTSPLIDAGTSLPVGAVDFDGIPRDEKWDIGPFEFVRLFREELDLNGDHQVNRDDLYVACESGDKRTTLAVLSLLGSLPGDADLDGRVSFSDFVLVARNFSTSGATFTQGDLDCDQQVQFADFNLLAGYFGQSYGSLELKFHAVRNLAREAFGSAQAVPEPSRTAWWRLGPLVSAIWLRRTGDRRM